MTLNAELPLETDVHSVKALLDAQADFVLLDCREADEHALVNIRGAQLLPMSELQNRVDALKQSLRNNDPRNDDDDKITKHIVVHCHHGGRSLRVTHWLREQGFANVQSLAGGIDRWAVEIDPTLARY